MCGFARDVRHEAWENPTVVRVRENSRSRVETQLMCGFARDVRREAWKNPSVVMVRVNSRSRVETQLVCSSSGEFL